MVGDKSEFYEDRMASPINLPKPSPNAFNSTGKLTRKHESMHERLSLPMLNHTPGTPRSDRSRFILPSSLSPFAFSPNNAKNGQLGMSNVCHPTKTPLRHGLSSDQLVFENNLSDNANDSPSRNFMDRLINSSPLSQLRDVDMLDVGSSADSNFDEDIFICDNTSKSCEVSMEMLKPLCWRNQFVHWLDLNYFNDPDLFDQNLEHDLDRSASDHLPIYFTEKFQVLESFRDGSFSTVYCVKDRSTCNISAVKRMNAPFSGANDRRKRLSEVQNLFLVKGCLHCIRIETAWEQNGYLYIQTEFCERGSLEKMININAQSDMKFSENQIWNIIRQLTIGLMHIHSCDIVHLDLKPANIFIDNNDIMKIGDFGLSFRVGEPHDLDCEGDKVYMAPEVLDGKYGKSADIFSLGLIALELAADVVLPGDGESWAAIRSGCFEMLSLDDVSATLSDLIISMLSPEPDKRPSANQILSSVRDNYNKHV